MNKQPLLQRRHLLRYLGLGAAGVGVAAFFHHDTNVQLPQLSAGSRSVPTSNTAEAATSASVPSSRSISLPAFQGIDQWLNSSPLTVGALKGSVVLVQFWTFSCINCQRTLPYIVKWNSQYAAQGLKVVGVHTPEFPFEKDVNNVKAALAEHQITYPVPIDNDFATWKAYDNHYWPHLFLADREGIVRYDHIGEGAYDTTEQTIRQMLG
ncbi:MAG: thioredoxin family protein [Phormidesmis sp.]